MSLILHIKESEVKQKIKIHNDIDTVVRICETNMKKYLGSLEHRMAKELINLAKKMRIGRY